VIKYSLIASVFLSIVVLGLTLPMPPNRDPVPAKLKVAPSIHCEGCHSTDSTGQALVDLQGNDVSIMDDWQVSMMAFSSRDPFWRATVAHEVNAYPTAQSAIETTCLLCHAPLGSLQHGFEGLPYSFEDMMHDSLGLDGVSCSACHQQPAKDLGKGHSGFFTIDTNRVLYGQFPNPFKGPMQIYVGFEPEFSDHIYSSGVCAGCHTLITETLDDAGNPSGNFFVEQATYHEWLNSSYPAQGKECQTCHLPFIEDGVVIATDLLALEPREPYGLHQFFGGNTAMLTLMREHREALGLPDAPEAAWDESINNNRLSLQNASALTVDTWQVQDDTLVVSLTIKNKTGHKLPSGYPSRLAWIQLVFTDMASSDTIFANGLMDADGHVINRDHPFEPHHEIIRSEDDVQIYELVMQDLGGHLTTRLNAAASPLKDNRLLPLGFRRTHHTYDTVAIWGNANDDSDYGATSQAGQDKVEYRIPLNGRKGFGNLAVSLHYQALPARWMNDLFQSDSLPLVNSFKNMYADYKQFDEVMQSISIEKIPLNPSSTFDPGFSKAIIIFPNPTRQFVLQVEMNTIPPGTTYQLISVDGNHLQQGKVTGVISLPESMTAGLYYIIFMTPDGRKAMKSFVRL
jgi:hypothetical protein